jgi:hypothetical protein
MERKIEGMNLLCPRDWERGGGVHLRPETKRGCGLSNPQINSRSGHQLSIVVPVLRGSCSCREELIMIF